MEGGNTVPDFRNYGVRASNLWTVVAILTISLACVATAAFATNTASFDGTDYLIGVGSYDVTGPAGMKPL